MKLNKVTLLSVLPLILSVVAAHSEEVSYSHGIMGSGWGMWGIFGMFFMGLFVILVVLAILWLAKEIGRK